MAEEHIDTMIHMIQTKDPSFTMSAEDREAAIQQEMLLRATAKNLGGGRTKKGQV
jgi:hypothetical protein